MAGLCPQPQVFFLSSSGMSMIQESVVNSVPAIEDEFLTSDTMTVVGSIIPHSIISQYSLEATLYPVLPDFSRIFEMISSGHSPAFSIIRVIGAISALLIFIILS